MNRSNAQCAIGIDLGANKIAAALVDIHGEPLVVRQVPTRPEEGVEAVVGRVAGLIDLLLQVVPLEQRLLGVGIGTPGHVDHATGVVRGAVNLGWAEVPLRDLLQARLKRDIPLWLQIDSNASAVGEFKFGAGHNCPDFVYLGIGTGLGGAAFCGGRLLEGASHYAMEVGHVSLDPQGPPCVCGQHGCAELLLSGPGLLNLTQRHLMEMREPTRLYLNAELEPAAIVRAARREDPLALTVFAEFSKQLGTVMAFCASLLNPARILIGGGLGLAAFDLLLPGAQAELQRRTLPVIHQAIQIVPAACKAAPVGAAALAWYYK